MVDRRKHQQNFLEFIPKHAVEHEVDPSGKLVLLRPKYVSGLGARLLQPRIKDKFFKVHLDAIGTATWEAIDGQRTVQQISDLLYDRFGDDVEPRYERCSRFIHSLHEGSLITLAAGSGDQEG